ncbi:MAG: MFS transporter [Elusimicrobia bacterium]|nr:MFS transporter [Elusimicrobiota bacterium]
MSAPVRARLWALLVCQCVLVAGLALSYPFFALYLHRVRGLPMGWVGAALSLMLAGTAVGQVLAGELSDIMGSKRVMEASVASRAAMVALMSWAMAREAPVGALIALHVLAGFCGSFYDSAVRCWIASALPPHERLLGYGKLRVAINLGWALGPACGGVMAEHSYPLLFAASGVACLACLGLVHWTVTSMPRLRPESRFSWRELWSVAADRRFLRLCGYGLLIAAVMAQLTVGLAVHSVRYVGLSEAQVGLLFTLNGALVVLTQTPISRSLRAVRLSAMLTAGCLLYAAGYCWAGFATGFALMAAAMTVVTLGEVTVSPALQTLAANLAPEKLKGRYLGFQGLALQSGAACGPLLGGLGLQVLSPRWSPAPWLIIAALAALAAFGFKRFGKELRPDEDGLHEAGLHSEGLMEVLT